MTPIEPPVRLLHLSDLAFSADWDWALAPIARGVVDAVRGMVAQGQGPDLVAITGDVATTGSPAEYARAAAWLREEPLPAAGLDEEALLLVPGERDVARDRIRYAARTLLAGLRDDGQDAIARVLADPNERGILLERLDPWLTFANSLRGSRPPLSVPWWYETRVVRGHDVGIIGLCSAWAATAEAGDRGHLLVGRWQVNTLLAPIRRCPTRIALLHHPCAWLHALDSALEQRLAHDVHMVLLGHEGDARAWAHTEASDTLVEVVAGPALTEGGAFAFIEVGEAGAVVVHPWLWVSGAQRWQPDRNRGPERFSWTSRVDPAAPMIAPSVPPAAPVWTPRPPPSPPDTLPATPYPLLGPYEHPATLGGRDADIDALVTFLAADRLVYTVHAPSGAGKSSVLRAGLLPRLQGHTGGGSPVPVAFDDHPATAGLMQRLLGQITTGAAPSEDAPFAVAAALAHLRDAAGHRPVLVLDQFEDVFRDGGVALGRLGALIAATEVAPGGRACRWLLVYRHEFHGRVRDWLGDVLRHASSLAPLDREALPGDLSGPGRSGEWRLPLLGDAGAVVDRLAAASDRFHEAITRPLTLGHYPWTLTPHAADRLAASFARSRVARPDDPLAPELQVVLARLMEESPPVATGPRALVVPADPDTLDTLIGRAIGDHLRRRLDELVARGDEPTRRRRRTAALLLLARLVDDEGRRRDVPLTELTDTLGDEARALLDGLQRSGVWLVRKHDDGAVMMVGLPHDRLAAEVRRLFTDETELARYDLNAELVDLWRFTTQRTAAWRGGAKEGDEAAVVVDRRRFRSLRARAGALPWEPSGRAWWAATQQAYRRRGRARMGWVAVGLALVAVFLAAVAWRADRNDNEALVRSATPASGDALRALDRLRVRHGYSGQELARVLGHSDAAADQFGADKRDELFGIGPAGLTEAERLAIVPPLVEALAGHVEGAENDESFYGALLAAVDTLRGAREAAKARAVVVAAMRHARGEPTPHAEDSWSPVISGVFEIGCFEDAGDTCTQKDETLHEVVLSPHRIRRYEETLGEYRQFDSDHLKKEGYPDEWPVISVSWYEAAAYTAWRGAALPTETQWEVAARGGTTQDYRKGAYYADADGDGDVDEDDLSRLGLFSGNASTLFRALGGQRPLTWKQVLRTTPPHPLGLVHVHGNIAEWTVDWYEADYPTSGPANPAGPPAAPPSARRVVRGGSWSNPAANARSAFRNWNAPSVRFSSVGLRLVLPQPGGSGS